MKKIINNKKYDTETAVQIGEYSNGYYDSDFSYCREYLYRKRTGEYFLHGKGGARTQYAEREGNMFCSGEAIIPLTWEKAREWAEAHMEADDYEAEFGEVAEDDSKRTVGLSLTAANVEAAKRLAAQRGVSLSALVDGLLEAAK